MERGVSKFYKDIKKKTGQSPFFMSQNISVPVTYLPIAGVSHPFHPGVW
jgi:hypothetical protein